MRVLALVTLPTLGAGNRLRVEQYVGPARAAGIDLVVSPFFDDRAYGVLYQRGSTVSKILAVLRGVGRRVRDLLRVRRFDLLLVYRESAPLGPPMFERLLRRMRVPYVFDFDDAIFLGPVHPANRQWAWLRPASRVSHSVALASAVIAGNEYLAGWARRYNRVVAVLPTPVDTERHRPATIRPPAVPLVLGWVGSSTTSPYLRVLDEPLARLARELDFTLRVVGGAYSHPSVRVEIRPYSLLTESAELAQIHVGLLPEPDDAWTRGKGAFKALLYMATGLPVVASRVGVNPDVIVEGETGYCVDDADGWVSAILRLAADQDLRSRLGVAGRARVESLYSVEALAPRFIEVLRGAADARPR